MIPCVHAGIFLTANNFIAELSVLSKQICSTLLTQERKINLFLYSKETCFSTQGEKNSKVRCTVSHTAQKRTCFKRSTSQKKNPAQLNSSMQHIPESYNVSKNCGVISQLCLVRQVNSCQPHISATVCQQKKCQAFHQIHISVLEK